MRKTSSETQVLFETTFPLASLRDFLVLVLGLRIEPRVSWTLSMPSAGEVHPKVGLAIDVNDKQLY